MSPRSGLLVITRPAREALAWSQALHAAGVPTLELPLIAIGPAPDPQALARRREAIGADRAVMFVSANAVRGFLDGAPPWPARTRAWATGPGTRAALLDAGVPAGQIDAPPEEAARFDSEALWAEVAPQVVSAPVTPSQPMAPAAPDVRPARVLIVRGADADGAVAGRDWLASQLQAHGVQVDQIAAYRRALPVWGEAERARLAQARAANAWWLFSSSEAVAQLVRLTRGGGHRAGPRVDAGAPAPACALAPPWPGARALCTHARIADAARAAGFGDVVEVAPLPGAVAAFLQSSP